MILVDTNVISELVKPTPEPAVVAFFRRAPPETVFTAVVCEAEICYGLARMSAGGRRNDLADRMAEFVTAAFSGRRLAFDSTCATLYSEIRVVREVAGKPIEVEDAMIAATARAYGAVVATRNVADFVDCGIHVVNPWIVARAEQR